MFIPVLGLDDNTAQDAMPGREYGRDGELHIVSLGRWVSGASAFCLGLEMGRYISLTVLGIRFNPPGTPPQNEIYVAMSPSAFFVKPWLKELYVRRQQTKIPFIARWLQERT
jgi:hypothetical protein